MGFFYDTKMTLKSLFISHLIVNLCMDLFNIPISKTKVRNGIFAYKYPNGVINIEGQKFMLYSIKDAIKIWRQKN